MVPMSLPKTPSAFRAKDLRLLPWSLIGHKVRLFISATEVQRWAFFRRFGHSSEASLPVMPYGPEPRWDLRGILARWKWIYQSYAKLIAAGLGLRLSIGAIREDSLGVLRAPRHETSADGPAEPSPHALFTGPHFLAGVVAQGHSTFCTAAPICS